MNRSVCAPLLCVCFAVAPILGQTPPAVAVPPVDPTLPELQKELKTLVADPKMAGDFQAIGLIQKLKQDPDKRNPKDHERLAKAFGDVFRTGKLRPEDKPHLYQEAADALGTFAQNGAKEIAKVLADPRQKDSLPVRCRLILALGKTQDDKQVDWLLDEAVRSPHDEIRAAAGEALGSFTGLELKQRREVVKQLIREWGSLHQRSTVITNNDPTKPIDPEPENARKTLGAIEGKWATTLSKLTGVSHSAFPDWQRWLNKNPTWTPPPRPK